MPSSLLARKRGQGLSEVALIVSLVAIAAIIILTTVGTTVSQVFSNVVCDVQGADPSVFPNSPCAHFTPSPAVSPSPSAGLPFTGSLAAVDTSNSSVSNPGQLVGISCTSTTFCMAVGANGSNGPAVVTFDGTTWSDANSASFVTSPQVWPHGVSCTSPTFCMAVGFFYDTGQASDQALVETWDGTSWTQVPVAAPANALLSGGSGEPNLAGVTCTSSTHCLAVGYYADTTNSNRDHTWALVWNGSLWTDITPSNTVAADGTDLRSVSCPTANSCMAVGRYTDFTGDANNGNYSALAESWNGSAWTDVSPTSPGIAGPVNFFTGVSCTGSFCMGVGSFFDNSFNTLPLAESWNGSSWTDVSPNSIVVSGHWYSYTFGGYHTGFGTSVSCVTSSFCVAVGADEANNGSGPFTPFVTIWDGSGWSLGTQPALGSNAGLDASSCVGPAANKCVGVGTANFQLLEEW